MENLFDLLRFVRNTKVILMAKNKNLRAATLNKNDEYYTGYDDIKNNSTLINIFYFELGRQLYG